MDKETEQVVEEILQGFRDEDLYNQLNITKEEVAIMRKLN
jgi:hypothetical protein